MSGEVAWEDLREGRAQVGNVEGVQWRAVTEVSGRSPGRLTPNQQKKKALTSWPAGTSYDIPNPFSFL
jgi:hypothetical protein